MGRVILDISMSLDGFISGPNDNHEQPLLDVRLFDNMSGQTELQKTGVIDSSGVTHFTFDPVK